eukprot:CCRYP_008676-RA/>CCRYP_008676-RA protein AED:0.41 eAED:0.41 QI:0/-1/0/1/-1/1/1/0/214
MKRSNSSTTTTEPNTMSAETRIVTGVPIEMHETVMDVNLSSSGLHLLKKADPFMFYSIPGARDPSFGEQELDLMFPRLLLGTSMPNHVDNADLPQRPKHRSRSISESHFEEPEQPRPRPRNRRRSISDSYVLVKRRSRISYESHFDVMLEGIINEMGELRDRCSKRRRSVEIEESKSEEPVKVECTEPRRGSILQDILLSMFESFREDGENDSE